MKTSDVEVNLTLYVADFTALKNCLSSDCVGH